TQTTKHITTLYPYTTLFRSKSSNTHQLNRDESLHQQVGDSGKICRYPERFIFPTRIKTVNLHADKSSKMSKSIEELKSLTTQIRDRKSTRLNSSHVKISYAV